MTLQSMIELIFWEKKARLLFLLLNFIRVLSVTFLEKNTKLLISEATMADNI